VDTNLHAWVQTPDFNDPNVIYAKTTTIVSAVNQLKRDGSNDTPRGRPSATTPRAGRFSFQPENTPSTAPTISRLTPSSSASGRPSLSYGPRLILRTTPPLLQSPNDPAATIMLADLKLLLPMNTTVDGTTGKVALLKWRPGPLQQSRTSTSTAGSTRRRT